MKTKVALLITLLYLALQVHSIAESKPNSASLPTTSSIAIGKQPQLLFTRAEAELSATKAQLSAIKEYHSSLLDTVYWSLTALGTIVALLAGFGWFANFRMYENDKSRLKEDLEAKIQAGLAQVGARLNEHEAQLLQQLDARLESSATRLFNELDFVRKDLAKSIEQSETRDNKLDSMVSALKSVSDTLIKENKETEALVREVEEHIWELKDIPINILLTQSQALSTAIDAESAEAVRSAMRRMKRTINDSILPKGHRLSSTLIAYLEEDLTLAAKTDSVLSAEVQALVKKIPVDDGPETA